MVMDHTTYPSHAYDPTASGPQSLVPYSRQSGSNTLAKWQPTSTLQSPQFASYRNDSGRYPSKWTLPSGRFAASHQRAPTSSLRAATEWLRETAADIAELPYLIQDTIEDTVDALRDVSGSILTWTGALWIWSQFGPPILECATVAIKLGSQTILTMLNDRHREISLATYDGKWFERLGPETRAKLKSIAVESSRGEKAGWLRSLKSFVSAPNPLPTPTV